ncbi:MAG: hypothetical protein ABSF29_13080 [Tepidisphaeraceae bacterium]|jgi:hypothetical protein
MDRLEKRISKPKLRRGSIRKTIETAQMVAILDVPVVYAAEMPQEPLLDAKTVKFLDEARRRTKAGDKRWLKRHGAEIFVSAPAA